MDDAEYVWRVLDSLREKDIPVDVDYVGTGYLSLRYLQKPPVDYIKLYQSLVAAMTLNKDSAAIVRSTINFAHDLGCKTVVKGVEAQERWELLARLSCDDAPTYFIASPCDQRSIQQ